jgi:hypothetical protein
MDELPRSELFDEELYLHTFPDIALAVSDGRFSSGYEHWARHGRLDQHSCSLRAATVSRALGPVTTWPATPRWVIRPSEGLAGDRGVGLRAEAACQA